MLPSLFSLVALLSYFTLISSFAIEGRNSWRLSHGLPPARPRRLHSSATETAHRRSTSSIPPMVNGGDFETDTSTTASPWIASNSGAKVLYGLSYTSPSTTHTGNGFARIYGSTVGPTLTSSITGLTPSTAYTVSYWAQVLSGNTSPCTVSVLVGGISVPGTQFSNTNAPYLKWVQFTGPVYEWLPD
ncbi:hypothetical protein DL96DRAFT_1685946 [Flagelloscypha sp. PMI_526]|nr:hypothetical protein DL96DRAFT_1685946 [Flagelloscypha sp. PMI_526]